jgi:hypothetical protein
MNIFGSLEVAGSDKYAGLNQFSTAETTLELARELGLDKLEEMSPPQRAAVLYDLMKRAKKLNRARARAARQARGQ